MQDLDHEHEEEGGERAVPPGRARVPYEVSTRMFGWY